MEMHGRKHRRSPQPIFVIDVYANPFVLPSLRAPLCPFSPFHFLILIGRFATLES